MASFQVDRGPPRCVGGGLLRLEVRGASQAAGIRGAQEENCRSGVRLGGPQRHKSPHPGAV